MTASGRIGTRGSLSSSPEDAAARRACVRSHIARASALDGNGSRPTVDATHRAVRQRHRCQQLAAPPCRPPHAIAAAVRAKRLRMTDQRRIIARVLSDRQGSPRRRGGLPARHALDPRISLSTVYRTIKLFDGQRASWSGTTSAPAAAATRRAARRHHDHLIDLETRPGHRVPQRGDRAHPGAGGARARLRPGRPQARALRRARRTAGDRNAE